MTTRVMVDPERKTGRRTRLTAHQVDQLITRYNNGETQKELAEHYGISVSTVQRYVKQRKTLRAVQ